MSIRKQKPQGRNLLDLVASVAGSKQRKTVEKLMVPVMPRGVFKFDAMEFWLDQFSISYQALLESHWEKGIARIDIHALAAMANEVADAALTVAEERWGKQRVK